MIAWQRWGLAIALVLAAGRLATAADRVEVVRRAADLLEEISTNRDSGIPPRFLGEAQGIMIVPHIVESQLGVGVKKGFGVFLTRDEKGAWGRPEAIEITKVSVGAEVGREVTDLVVICRTRQAVARTLRDSVSLSLSARAAATLRHRARFDGPKDDGRSEGPVLAYTRKAGLAVAIQIGSERHLVDPVASSRPKPLPEPSREPAVGGPKVAQGPGKPEAPGAIAGFGLAGESPDMIRLRKAVAAMTAPPAAQVAGADRDKDPNVAPASAEAPSRRE